MAVQALTVVTSQGPFHPALCFHCHADTVSTQWSWLPLTSSSVPPWVLLPRIPGTTHISHPCLPVYPQLPSLVGLPCVCFWPMFLPLVPFQENAPPEAPAICPSPTGQPEVVGGWRVLLCHNKRPGTTSAQNVPSPAAGGERLHLKAVVGYNGNGRANVIWRPDTGKDHSPEDAGRALLCPPPGQTPGGQVSTGMEGGFG